MGNFFSSLGGFWTRVDDLESAKEASSLGGIIAAYLAASYLVVLSFLVNGVMLFGEMPQDSFEYNLTVITLLIFFALGMYFAYKTYLKKSFTFIPFIFIWLIIEISFSTSFSHPFIFLIMKFLLFVIAVNSIVGWLGIKKYKS